MLYSDFLIRSVLLAIFVSAFSLILSAQIATPAEIDRDLKLVPCKSADRLAAVQNLFKSLGATDSDMSVIEKKGTKNLVVTKKGTSDQIIVVGAHYDKVDDGCGAIDNWTGIVTIAHLYATLSRVPTTKTFKFIAFDREEQGLIGSDVFVHDIPKADRASYCAMINLDSFGFSSTQVLTNVSSPKLVDAAKDFWQQMKLQLSVASLTGTADADSSSFVSGGIPAITFHGLSNDWQKYLHSSRDQLKAIDVNSVFIGYRTILPFLAHTDKADCSVFRK